MNTSFESSDAYGVSTSRYLYRKADGITAWMAWIIGYLFCVVTPVSHHLWGAFIFTVLLFGGGMLYFHRVGDSKRIPVRAWVIAAVSVALSAGFLWSTNRVIMALVFIFNCMAWFYMVYVLGGNSLETIPNSLFIKEWCKATFVMPFRAKGHLFGAMARRKKDGEKGLSRIGLHILWVIIGLSVALIPTVIVALLLSYDTGFSSLLDSIAQSLLSWKALPEQIANVLLGLLVGLIIFAALLASRDRRGVIPKEENNPDSLTEEPPFSAHFCPVTVICAALTPILALYVIFFISQWDYYISAICGIRPEELTYANYAREGFFQLCAVAGINAGLAILASFLTRRRPEDPAKPKRDPMPPALRAYMVVLAVFTLVLIATAAAKMLLYVDTYGLTPRRVYATWFIFLLAAAFVAVLLHQLWRRMNLIGTLLAVFLLFFGFLALVNTDAMIAQYNVTAYLNGNPHAMEGEILEDVGVAGVLPALEFMEETSDCDLEADPTLAALRQRIHGYLCQQAHDLENASLGELNITALRARAALRAAGYDKEP